MGNNIEARAVLTDLDAHEISLVPKAANRRKFMILKTDDDPQERNRFLVPVVIPVDDATELHPFAGLPVQAIAESLLHEKSSTAR